jgi:hypothetical protein
MTKAQAKLMCLDAQCSNSALHFLRHLQHGRALLRMALERLEIGRCTGLVEPRPINAKLLGVLGARRARS